MMRSTLVVLTAVCAATTAWALAAAFPLIALGSALGGLGTVTAARRRGASILTVGLAVGIPLGLVLGFFALLFSSGLVPPD